MKKYTYRNKRTKKTVTSDKLLNDPDLVLVAQVRNGMMKSKQVRTK